jgi:hypothetical protein
MRARLERLPEGVDLRVERLARARVLEHVVGAPRA